MRARKIGERITTEVTTTDRILRWPDETQKRVRTELRSMFREAFPKTSEQDINTCVADVFKRPGRNFHRQVIFLREETGRLIALTIFDQGPVRYGDQSIKGVYVLIRVVVPKYQGIGLGYALIAKIFVEWQPDVLLTTCAQSATLHSWVRLPQKIDITDFEVYPRLERDHSRTRLITVPPEERNFVITAFKQTYIGVVDGDIDSVDNAIRELTVHMVRKGIYKKMYDFHPWKKHGREDRLAIALGVTEKDGILVVLRKNTTTKK